MMDEKLIDLSELNMSDDELFATVDHDTLASEKITAPRYSYWHSVFRVFFKKKLNIVILSLLAVMLRVIVPNLLGSATVSDTLVVSLLSPRVSTHAPGRASNSYLAPSCHCAPMCQRWISAVSIAKV